MSRKSIIVFVLLAGVAAALVFDGISHRNRNNDNLVPLNQITATASSAASANSSIPGTDAQATASDLNSDPNAAANQSGQDAVGGYASEEQTVDDTATADTVAAADAIAPADDAPQSDADAAPPATDPIFVPTGTTLTVRLGEDVGSSVSRANQRFSATLDRDVVVHGQTVIAAGASVTGRVVSAKPAGPLTGEAKLQLKITGINLDNGNLRIVTSTRSFGPTIKGKNMVGRFMKGLVKRASGQEKEVLLAERTQCSFTLQQRLAIR